MKNLRLENDVTQAELELAQVLNVKRSSISNYETSRKEPDFNTLIKIADYFKVSTDYLLCRILCKF